jgi:hypothetical protein
MKYLVGVYVALAVPLHTLDMLLVRSIENSIGLIGNRTRDFPVCSIVPHVSILCHY